MSTEVIWQTVSTSSADTERLGQLLGQALKPPAVVELVSDLGGGKTTFARGLVKGLGSADTVTSPTFTLKKNYKTRSTEIYHYDFYRLSKPGLMQEELAESLKDPKSIVVIEWSGIVADVLPTGRLTIRFKPTTSNPEEREVSFSYAPGYEKIIRQLGTAWGETQP